MCAVHILHNISQRQVCTPDCLDRDLSDLSDVRHDIVIYLICPMFGMILIVIYLIYLMFGMM